MEESFSIRQIGEYNQGKITAAAYLNDYFVITDEKGMLKVFKVTKTNLEPQADITFPKNKPCEKIVYRYKTNHIFCLVNGEIFVYKLPKLELISELKAKDPIVSIAINATDFSDTHRILTVNKKKKIKLYELDLIGKSFIENKTDTSLSVIDIPDKYQWYGDIFVYYTVKAKKTVISWLIISQNITKSMNDLDVTNIQYVNGKAIDGGTIAITPDLALFLDVGTVKSLSPIPLVNVTVVDITEVKNFIIFLEKNIFRVYMPNEQNIYASVQHEKLPQNEEGYILVDNQARLIYISKQELGNNQCKHFFYYVTETPYTQVNIKLLSSGQFDEALAKINDNVGSCDENKEAIIEQYYLDCAWNCVRLNQYEKAYQYCHLTNFDPFEFCYLFQTMLELQILHTDKEKEIKENLSKNQISSFMMKDTSGNKDLFKQAKRFLYKILLAKRKYFLTKFDFPKDNDKTIKFADSKFSIIDLSKSTTKIKLIDMLDYINVTLIKIMIENEHSPKEIAAIIDHNSFECKGFCDFSEDKYFVKEGSNRRCALAYLYEKKGEFEKALKVWKSYGSVTQTKFAMLISEARERTAKIFKAFQKDEKNKTSNLKLFEEYIKWILTKEPEKAFKIAIDASTPLDKTTPEFITIDFFLETILPKVGNKEKELELKEKFLVFLDCHSPSTIYQTMLIEIYIDKLFKIYPSSFTAGEFTGEAKRYRDLLLFALQKPDSVYNKSKILERIKDSWLKEEEIYLYSELKMFNEALNKLLLQATSASTIPNFEQVEKFCDDNLSNKSDIFSNLLTKIIELKAKAEPGKEKVFDDEILNILNKYGDVNKLDPVFAFQNIPTNMNVSQDSILSKYIEKVFKQYTSLTNKYKIARNISDMALIYKEKEVLEEKHKGVFIENETTCCLCNKKIGNTFVIYPNMKLFHPKCATNLSVCPSTGCDFSKKKAI